MMKTKILLAAIVVAFSATTSVKAQGFEAGIKAGAEIHKIDGKEFADEFSYGYHAGGFAHLKLGSKFGVQPEVMFSSVKVDTSANFRDVYNFNNVKDVQLKYLKIPLLLTYSPNPFVTLQAGPQYGILLDKEKSLVNNGKAAFSNGDFSMVGGVQLNISKLRLYGRYTVGLNNINEIDNQDKWKNQNFQVGVGFALF
ncbi:MAG: PorT family protein [Chitinophagaceae bacterium]|nr:MAG: PorT family protein [Chitinophagaceae bacterium]